MNSGYGVKQIAYHFTNPSRDNIISYGQKVTALNAILCMDLEDIVPEAVSSGIVNPKKINRETVMRQLKAILSSSASSVLGVRLNRLGSDEFKDDLLLLEELRSAGTPFFHIFLPKVNNVSDIDDCVDALAKLRIDNYELIPIIETKKSFDDMDLIIADSSYRISKVAFGHCDFNFDTNQFPFFHQFDPAYWNWVESIYHKIGPDILFINSPFLFLRDEESFQLMLKHLSQLFGSGFGQVTLTLNQLAGFNNFVKGIMHYLSRMERKPDNYVDYARWIVSSFEKHRLPDKSFALTDNKIIISPQEYSAAGKYLNDNGEK